MIGCEDEILKGILPRDSPWHRLQCKGLIAGANRFVEALAELAADYFALTVSFLRCSSSGNRNSRSTALWSA